MRDRGKKEWTERQRGRKGRGGRESGGGMRGKKGDISHSGFFLCLLIVTWFDREAMSICRHIHTLTHLKPNSSEGEGAGGGAAIN